MLRFRWLVASAALFAGFLAFHLPITHFCEWLIVQLGFEGYQHAMAGGFALAGLAAVALLAWRPSDVSRTTIPAAMALIAAAALAHHFIVLVNVEQIHLAQYALLAITLARAGFDAQTVWLTATSLGVVDEAYQFLVLRAGRPDYLDWNDISLNGLGAALGVIVLCHFGAVRTEHRRPWTAAAAGVAAFAAALTLLISPPVGRFYTVTPAGLRSHVFSAAEGVLFVCAIYFGVCWVIRNVDVARDRPRLTAETAETISG